MDPNDILFSTSTLNDALPKELGSSTPGQDCYRMHEDNWRQFEFVSAAFETEIASELAAIDEIWRDQSVPLNEGATAFRNVHIRKIIPHPLDVSLPVADFEKLFGQRVSPITLNGYEKTLRDVHAARLENVIIYGAFDRERMVTLGIEPLDRFVIADDVADRLESFVIKHDLRLTHWPSRTRFETPQAAMKYLRGGR